MALEHAGQSIIGRLWDQADVQYERLQDMIEELEDPDLPDSEDEVKLATQKGKLQGLAYALTIMQDMYGDVGEGIKRTKKEIHARWLANQEEDDES
jgi:hypothetical protein